MKVWVTREEGPDGPLSTALRKAGLEPILEPVVMRRVVNDCRSEIAALTPNDWLVLTSAFAIEAVPADVARIPRVAVVGDSSRQLGESRGLRVELVSEKSTGASLFELLNTLASGCTVCYPRSSLATPPQLPEDITLISPVLYETTPREFRRAVIDEADVIAVASPSAVRAVGPVDLPFASIGPTTTTALRERGAEPWVEAAEPSFEALAGAIADQVKP